MALLFSAVTVTAGHNEAEFLVGEIPREYGDLEGWTAFDELMEETDAETEVSVHAEAYLLGFGETYKAAPEDIAYIMKRSELDEDYISKTSDNIKDVDFSFVWSPDELYGMEM